MRTILVVDDEPEIRAIVAETLVSAGYVVIEAGGCRAALVVLARQPVTLLLTDIRMPCCTGTDLAEQAHALYPMLRIILMTGFAINGFAHPCLAKPFRMVNMLATVRAMLTEQPVVH